MHHSLNKFPVLFGIVCALTRRPFQRDGKVARKSWIGPSEKFAGQTVPIPAEKYLEDPEVAIYKTHPNAHELEDLERYKDGLKERALRKCGARPGTPCCVDVHYSWACLERLQQALELGRSIAIGSVLLPDAKLLSPENMSLSRRCSPLVFQATGNLINAGLAIKGSRNNFCRFVVAFASLELSNLKGPFIVIDKIASSHSLGQILRTAYHFGIDSVILSKAAWQLLDSRAMRVSVGWGYHLDFHVAAFVPETLRELQHLGVGLFGINDRPIVEEEDFREPLEPWKNWERPATEWALLLGCDLEDELEISPVRVPCHPAGAMDIAHAAAISMYELCGLSSKQSADRIVENH
eukprot:Skav210349  [mRNA]  locus=scaffold1491:3703:4755:+ [translate_table: standard]